MTDYPFMPVDVAALIADTEGLTAEEFGAYVRLLGHMWLHKGWVPDDDRDLLRMTKVHPPRWKKVKAKLIPYLIFEGNDLSQKRLLKERDRLFHRSGNNASRKRFLEAKNRNGTLRKTNELAQDFAEMPAPPARATHNYKKKEKEKEKRGAAIGSSLGMEGRSEPPPEKSGDVAPRRRTSDWDLPPSPGPYGQTTFLTTWKPRP